MLVQITTIDGQQFYHNKVKEVQTVSAEFGVSPGRSKYTDEMFPEDSHEVLYLNIDKLCTYSVGPDAEPNDITINAVVFDNLELDDEEGDETDWHNQ